MGAYLSQPIFEPESSEGVGRGLSFGASSVQGWRMSQEDAHNCIIDYDDDCSFFAVYDGHGGSEVAKYCSLHLPAFVKTLSSYKAKDYKQALIDAFLKFDETLTKPDTIEALKQLAQTDSGDEEDEDEVREETDKLREEAKMPLHELLKYYMKAQGILNDQKKESNGTDGKENNQDPEKHTEDSNRGDEESKEGTKDGKNDNKAKHSSGEDSETNAVVSRSSEQEKKQEVVKNEKKQKDKDENGLQSERSTSSNGKSTEGSAGSSSENVAPSASGLHPVPSASRLDSTPAIIRPDDTKPAGTRGGRAAAQRARRIITTEENNNNNNNDDDDDDDDDEDVDEENDSDSASEEDSEDQDGDDDDDADDFDEEDTSDDDDDEDIENDNDVEMFDSDVPGSGSGTTAVVALLNGDVLTVANAGDSRAVICRSGKAIDLSIDHKPEDPIERARIERAGGKITADGRVNGGLNLSRAIGDHVYKQNSKLLLVDQMISPLPDVQSIVIDRLTDEFMILACDGIWNCMTSQEVCDFVTASLRQGDKLIYICEQLFRRCIAPDNGGDGTGCDNMTCILVCFSDEIGQKRVLEESGEEGQEKKKSKKSHGEDTGEQSVAASGNQ